MSVESRLAEVFDDILQTGDAPDADLPREQYDNWDSLANVTLLMAINEEFGDKLEIEDIARLDSFGKIAAFLSEKE